MPITSTGLTLVMNSFFVPSPPLFGPGQGLYVHFYNDIVFNSSSKVNLPRNSFSSDPNFVLFGNYTGTAPQISSSNTQLLDYKATSILSFRYISLHKTNTDFQSLWYIELDQELLLRVDDEFVIPTGSIRIGFNLSIPKGSGNVTTS